MFQEAFESMVVSVLIALGVATIAGIIALVAATIEKDRHDR